MSAPGAPSADPARMRPLYFDGRFGWLHGSAAPGATGVVLCGALAQEEICTRYGLMTLADRLAAAGRPTLRFDYRGTGDSADVALTPATMVEDIARAVDCLRAEAGVGPVVLCGLRIGATLAVEAAASIPGVIGLALLAPIVSGAAYLRDLGVSVRFSPLALLDPVPPTGSEAPLNTNGFLWSAAQRDTLRDIDLAALPCCGAPVWVASPHASGRAGFAMAGWAMAGAEVTEAPFPDYPAFMRDPTTNIVPEETFAAATAWIAGLTAGDAAPAPAPITVTDRLLLGEVEERAVRLGPDGANVGILCQPAGRAASPVAALMLHEGSSHHVGNGRGGVRLARRLAAAGHASLRLDLTGMGDSPDMASRGRPFSDPDRVREAVAGVELLSGMAPGGIVTSGLCSGAEMALHTALADARVTGAILANLPAIGWEQTEGDAPPPPPRRTWRSSWRALRAGGWRRLVRGEIRVIDAARSLRRRRPQTGASTPALPREQMAELAGRGVRTLFVFSDDDPGLPEVRTQLGDIAAFAPAEIAILDRSDHHFNALDTRRRYDDLYVRAIDDLAARHRDTAVTPAAAREGGR